MRKKLNLCHIYKGLRTSIYQEERALVQIKIQEIAVYELIKILKENVK